jgi:hypothetical protein
MSKDGRPSFQHGREEASNEGFLEFRLEPQGHPCVRVILQGGYVVNFWSTLICRGINENLDVIVLFHAIVSSAFNTQCMTMGCDNYEIAHPDKPRQEPDPCRNEMAMAF